MTISIVGAGMSGLLAGAMLRNNAYIYEAAKALPNNHHALLRFRTDIIAQHLNIEFQAVEVIKIVKPFRNKVAEAVAYSMKSNGRASLRSIKTAEGKIDKRFIAPSDFIAQLELMQSTPVSYDYPVDRDMLGRLAEEGPVISTIPMPTLMKIVGWEDRPEFNYRNGWVVKANLIMPSDLCATIYYPDPEVPVIRATLTGEFLQVEMVAEFDQGHWAVDRVMEHVLNDFGISNVAYSAEMVPQQYAKISPIADRERRKFIMAMTDQFNVFSLGRFAIWKTGILLDDVFHDIIKIQQMIRNGHNYEGRLPTATK